MPFIFLIESVFYTKLYDFGTENKPMGTRLFFSFSLYFLCKFLSSIQINVFMVHFIPIHLSGLYLPLNLISFIFNVIFSCITLNSFKSMSLNALVKEKLYPQNDVLEVELYTREIVFIL